MKSLRTTNYKAPILILFIFPLIITLVYFYNDRSFIFKEKYSQAVSRCGSPPVIGVSEGEEKYYLIPGDEDRELLSMYNKSKATDDKYRNSKFFCSLDKAENNGYTRQ